MANLLQERNPPCDSDNPLIKPSHSKGTREQDDAVSHKKQRFIAIYRYPTSLRQLTYTDQRTSPKPLFTNADIRLIQNVAVKNPRTSFSHPILVPNAPMPPPKNPLNHSYVAMHLILIHPNILNINPLTTPPPSSTTHASKG